MDDDGQGAGGPVVRHRRHKPSGQGRRDRLRPTFAPDELAAIRVAAAAAGLTPTGYVAAVAVAAATGAQVPAASPRREALAAASRIETQLRKVGTNLNQAVAAFHRSGSAPAWLADAVAQAVVAIGDVDGVVDQLMRGQS